MQAIIVTLVEEFEFSLPRDYKGEPMEILRTPVGLMSPVINGRFKEGIQMPLKVKRVIPQSSGAVRIV